MRSLLNRSAQDSTYLSSFPLLELEDYHVFTTTFQAEWLWIGVALFGRQAADTLAAAVVAVDFEDEYAWCCNRASLGNLT